MNKKSLIIIFTGCLVWSASAETPKAPGPEGRRADPRARMERLAERLNLSEDQRQRLRGLMAKHGSEAQAIRANENLAPEDKRGQLKALREQHRAEVASILTPEQKAQWDAMRQRLRDIRAERREDSERSRSPRPGAGEN